jgi:hypothetical protein
MQGLGLEEEKDSVDGLSSFPAGFPGLQAPVGVQACREDIS